MMTIFIIFLSASYRSKPGISTFFDSMCVLEALCDFGEGFIIYFLLSQFLSSLKALDKTELLLNIKRRQSVLLKRGSDLCILF